MSFMLCFTEMCIFFTSDLNWNWLNEVLYKIIGKDKNTEKETEIGQTANRGQKKDTEVKGISDSACSFKW